MMISFVKPHGRVHHFANCGFSDQLEIITIRTPPDGPLEDEGMHFAYLLRPAVYED